MEAIIKYDRIGPKAVEWWEDQPKQRRVLLALAFSSVTGKVFDRKNDHYKTIICGSREIQNLITT